ncbi:MAG: DUF2909 domain-containing protein [Gammaproteobacteria bacterium]|nr:DUF2909 domain-containing protein [Gammaproteobacteria bacterium]
MLAKLVILLLLLLMVASLAAALVFMYKDRGRGTRTVNALTVRVSIWVVLFVLLLVGVYSGLITPSNSLRPHSSNSSSQ